MQKLKFLFLIGIFVFLAACQDSGGPNPNPIPVPVVPAQDIAINLDGASTSFFLRNDGVAASSFLYGITASDYTVDGQVSGPWFDLTPTSGPCGRWSEQ
ncbi:MAG: hypothetical protein R2880_13965 [Deinococcales bacterium]